MLYPLSYEGAKDESSDLQVDPRRQGVARINLRCHGWALRPMTTRRPHAPADDLGRAPTIWKIAALAGNESRPELAFLVVTTLIFCAPEETRTPKADTPARDHNVRAGEVLADNQPVPA